MLIDKIGTFILVFSVCTNDLPQCATPAVDILRLYEVVSSHYMVYFVYCDEVRSLQCTDRTFNELN